jgi:hypothetical protein
MSKIGWREENDEGDRAGESFCPCVGWGLRVLRLAVICFEPADHVRCFVVIQLLTWSESFVLHPDASEPVNQHPDASAPEAAPRCQHALSSTRMPGTTNQHWMLPSRVHTFILLAHMPVRCTGK